MLPQAASRCTAVPQAVTVLPQAAAEQQTATVLLQADAGAQQGPQAVTVLPQAARGAEQDPRRLAEKQITPLTPPPVDIHVRYLTMEATKVYEGVQSESPTNNRRERGMDRDGESHDYSIQ